MARIIPPWGSLQARVYIIGEAPGVDEDAIGEPFVGQAGRELDDLLSLAGLSKNQCRINNVICERPPNNDISLFISFDRAGNARTTPAYEHYVKQLYKDIEETRPNVLVPLGNTALYAICGHTGISKYRGSILKSKLGFKAIPTLHPASVLPFRGKYIDRYLVLHDLIRVAKEMEYPDIRLTERKLYTKPGFLEALSLLRGLKEREIVGFDIETSLTTHEMTCFSVAPSPTESYCIPLITNGKHFFNPDEETAILIALSELLEHPKTTKVGHNINFDSTFLLRRYGMNTWPVEDTMIAFGILYPEFRKGLYILTSIYTDQPYYKDDDKQYLRFAGSEESFWRYSALDSCVCLESFLALLPELQKHSNYPTYCMHRDLLGPLLYMQERGILVDIQGCREDSEKLLQEIKLLTAQLHEIAGKPINPNSPTQLKEYFYTHKGAKPYIHRKTGGVSTDEEALKRLKRKGHVEADLIMRLREITKFRSTYLNMTFDEDGRMRSMYNSVGTKFGRLSSSATLFKTGSNMQNLPPEMKFYMKADDGYVIVNIDLEQAENRVVAYIAPDIAMQEAFERGTDIHSLTASLIFGVPVNQISSEPGSCDIGGGKYSQRDWGKRANHAFNYGYGPESFSQKFEIARAEGQLIYNAYHGGYPGVRQYRQWITRQLRETGELVTPFGRHIRMWDFVKPEVALSAIPQSTVAHVINARGLLYVHREQTLFRHFELLNQVHDSMVFQYPQATQGLEALVEGLKAIVVSLQQPIEWQGQSFSIPAGIEIGFRCKKRVKGEPAEKTQGCLRKLPEISVNAIQQALQE